MIILQSFASGALRSCSRCCLCFLTPRYTELHHYYKLSDTLRLLRVHLRYIQHHLVVFNGGGKGKKKHTQKKKNRRCAFRREGEQKKSSGYVLLKSRLACCNVCFLKWSRFWGNWLYKSLGGNLWRVKIQGHMLSSSQPASLCSATHPVFFFWEGGRESDWEGKEGGRKKKKSLLTHKLVNAVALSTFSSNENFRHLHINLISCVSLSSLPLLH